MDLGREEATSWASWRVWPLSAPSAPIECPSPAQLSLYLPWYRLVSLPPWSRLRWMVTIQLENVSRHKPCSNSLRTACPEALASMFCVRHSRVP